MTKKSSITRRVAVGTGIAAAAGIVLVKARSVWAQSGTRGARRSKVPMPKNEDFYDGGKFLPDNARQAYYDMFKRFAYPNPKPQQELMWVQDFGLGDFVGAGMAGVFWWNNKEHNYFGHSIYLLPGQQIPEHKHIALPDSGVVAKMEAWHCTHGMIHCLGEGPETRPMPIKLPKSQESFRTVKNATRVLPGEVLELNRLEAFHFMIAGPEGAIVSEFATYHDGEALRFANPNVTLE